MQRVAMLPRAMPICDIVHGYSQGEACYFMSFANITSRRITGVFGTYRIKQGVNCSFAKAWH
jgi:hypothetical protein